MRNKWKVIFFILLYTNNGNGIQEIVNVWVKSWEDVHVKMFMQNVIDHHLFCKIDFILPNQCNNVNNFFLYLENNTIQVKGNFKPFPKPCYNVLTENLTLVLTSLSNKSIQYDYAKPKNMKPIKFLCFPQNCTQLGNDMVIDNVSTISLSVFIITVAFLSLFLIISVLGLAYCFTKHFVLRQHHYDSPINLATLIWNEKHSRETPSYHSEDCNLQETNN